MASAQVTIKISPEELQILNAALRTYAHIMTEKLHGNKAPRKDVKLVLGSWVADARIANTLIQSIGLK